MFANAHREFGLGSGVRRVAAVFLVALAVAVLPAALPAVGGDGPLDRLAPQVAEAYQGGWDRDHWWIKVTRGEVAAGAVTVICLRFVPSQIACRSVAQVAKRIIGGKRGFWAEVYRTGRIRAGTW